MKIALCYYGLIRKLDFLNDLQENEIFDYFISAGIDDVKPGNIEDKFKSSNIEQDRDIRLEPILHNIRTAKTCYHINKVVRLKEQYEIKNNFSYDAIILLRTDYKYSKKDLLKYGIRVKEVSDSVGLKPVCLVKEQPLVNKNMMLINHDDLYVHNNEGANLHANLYNSLFLQKNHEKLGVNFETKTDAGHYSMGFLLSRYPFYIISLD